ncbi:uncharacterized protein LOC142574705 [Dermacentor variabilis]|uniref:uncharacterized protein LOC142574705 n=1 Tax=Dermacentor variabilis TaxID=34621 RepID=UPI003F5B158F
MNSASSSLHAAKTARAKSLPYGDLLEDVEDWLADFECVAQFNGWDDESKLRNVYFSLRDGACTWFKNREGVLTSWREFSSRLLDTYASYDRRERAEWALQSYIQKPNESVAMYLEDMVRVFRVSRCCLRSPEVPSLSLGHRFTIVTDRHSLCCLVGLRYSSGRLAQWVLRLQEFDFSVRYKCGPHYADADYLSRLPLQTSAIFFPNLATFRKEQRDDRSLNAPFALVAQPTGHEASGEKCSRTNCHRHQHGFLPEQPLNRGYAKFESFSYTQYKPVGGFTSVLGPGTPFGGHVIPQGRNSFDIQKFEGSEDRRCNSSLVPLCLQLWEIFFCCHVLEHLVRRRI